MIDDNRLFLCGIKFDGQIASSFEEIATELNPETDKITQVSCSAFHLLIVVNDVDVYSAGCNTWGNLGRNTTGQTQLPLGRVVINRSPSSSEDADGDQVMNSDKPKSGWRVKKIGCGAINSLILFENGELYTCYSSYLEPKKSIVFEKVVLPFTEPIQQLHFSPLGTHMMLQTKSDLWACGSNKYGQLLTGHFQTVNGVQKCDMKSFIGDANYRLFLLRGRTFIATRDHLYAIGDNRYGQLGTVNTTTNYQLQRVAIDFSDKELVSMEGGYDYTLFTCRQSTGFIFMNNLSRQRTNGHFADVEIKHADRIE